MTEVMPQTWQSVLDRLPELLRELKGSALLSIDKQGQFRDSHCGSPAIPKRGLYVFYEKDKEKPLYVGRSNRLASRIQEHGRPSSLHNSATLAFLMAARNDKREDTTQNRQTRDQLQEDPQFKSRFVRAKDQVRKLKFRVVRVDDAIEQSVFEIYAALNLGTTIEQKGYNDFNNH